MNCRNLLILVSLSWSASPLVAQNWAPTAAPLTNWSSIASSADRCRLVALGAGSTSFYAWPGPICVSTNGGMDWTTVAPLLDTGFPEPMVNWRSAASSAEGNRLFAVGEAPGDDGFALPIFQSTNGGALWTPAGTNMADSWIWVATSGDARKVVAISTHPNGVFVSKDSGATWTATPLAISVGHAAWSADGTALVLAGADLATSTNDGTTWFLAGLTNTTWASVAASAEGSQLVAAESPGGIYTSTDHGRTWSATSAPTNYWTTLSSSADGKRLIAGAGGYRVTTGAIYTSNKFGGSLDFQ